MLPSTTGKLKSKLDAACFGLADSSGSWARPSGQIPRRITVKEKAVTLRAKTPITLTSHGDLLVEATRWKTRLAISELEARLM